MKKRNIKAVIEVLPQVAEVLSGIGYRAGTAGDNPPSKDRLDNQIQPLLDELAKSLLDEQAERIKANYADEYMSVEPSPSEERALLLRQSEIAQEHHTQEILRLQELVTWKQSDIKMLRSQLEEKDTDKQAEIESLRSQLEHQTRLAIGHDGQYQMAEAENETLKSEIYRLREIIESMKASGNLQRKAVKVAILQFPLMAKAFSDLADSVESPEGKAIISNFASMADEAHDTIIEALNLNRVQH